MCFRSADIRQLHGQPDLLPSGHQRLQAHQRTAGVSGRPRVAPGRRGRTQLLPGLAGDARSPAANAAVRASLSLCAVLHL